MDKNKVVKIGLIALVFSLLALNTAINGINQSDTTKVNKSGDTWTSGMVYNPDNINMVTNTNNVQATDSLYAVTGCDGIPGCTGNTIMAMQASNNATGATNFFGAYKTGYNGTSQQKYPLGANDMIFNFYGKGWDGTTWGTSAANIVISTGTTVWNSTNHPTKIDIYVNSGTGKTIRFSVNESGNITMSKYAGTGNAYACFDPAGTLYRGSPGC